MCDKSLDQIIREIERCKVLCERLEAFMLGCVICAAVVFSAGYVTHQYKYDNCCRYEVIENEQ